MLTSKAAAKPPPKLKRTPSQHSTIPPTFMHPPAATKGPPPTKPSASTRNSSCTRSKATVVADNDFNVGSDSNKIDDMQPSTQDRLIIDSDVDEVEDQDEPSGLVESDQDDNYVPEEAPLEQEDEGAAEEEEQVEEAEPGVVEDGMDVNDMANIQLLEQQLAATKERMNNKRKCNVNAPTPATSQAKHDVLDAHLRKKQKTLKTGLRSIDSIRVIHERQAAKGGYASTSAKNPRNATLSRPSTNPAPTAVCGQSSLETMAISQSISGSNISIAPSESGIPSGTGSTTGGELKGSMKDDQLSHYSGVELMVITQAKRYLNLYIATQDAFPGTTTIQVFIGKAWDLAKTDSEAPNQQMLPAIEKLLRRHISRARNRWKEAAKAIVENYYELSGYAAEIQERVEYLTDKYRWTYGLLKLMWMECCLCPFGHPAISSLIQKIAFEMKDGVAQLQSSVLEPMPFATIALAICRTSEHNSRIFKRGAPESLNGQCYLSDQI
ncbi:hypothetical protein M422DRAFT_242538 [Sphaerobolus stellatus SS14]|nr:hypothetical protein M422DRAFT_242538 [Sphaerobolus stellatus SS14]